MEVSYIALPLDFISYISIFSKNIIISAGEEESLNTRGYARMRRKGKYGKRRKTEST